jgi:hypothetical protein
MAKYEVVLEHREEIEAESNEEALTLFETRILCNYESIWHFVRERTNIIAS